MLLLLCVFRMLCHADLSQAQLASLALNLWNLAQKHGFGNTKYTVSTRVVLSESVTREEMPHALTSPGVAFLSYKKKFTDKL